MELYSHVLEKVDLGSGFIRREVVYSCRPLFDRSGDCVPFFGGHAGRRSMCLQVCRVDHHGPTLTVFRSQPGHYPRENALLAPTFPPDIEHLVRAVSGRSIASAQPIAIDEDNPTLHPPVIDPQLAMRLREESGKLGHLLVSQPAKVAHVTAPFFEP